MEVMRLCSGTAYSVTMVFSPMEAVVTESHKSLAFLLLAIGSLPKDVDLFLDALGVDKRFPLSELNRVTKPNAGNKDASETEDDDDDDDDDGDDDDDDDDDNDDDDDGLSGEESDGDGDPDDDTEANGDGGSNDDDDDDDDDDDSDEDDDEDEEDEEDEQAQPPYKKKK
ncbi:hypothetical protein Acr_23g0002410 [Actinidia rufa]|uniref:Uncharacterized protein n=1 Tax=Actinidia rufa TaxID=165716 RepID=A0A7J0GM10_9ERIC|nr:hypothetical protein Acr_23g0002410 [Actinidia rufa]